MIYSTLLVGAQRAPTKKGRMDYSRLWYLLFVLITICVGYLAAHLLSRAQNSSSIKLPYQPILIAIIIIGAALRFYGINFGLPHNYHSDEVPKVNAIMNMVSNGDLNPRYFLHPSLLLYSSYFLAKFFAWFDPAADFRELVALSGRLVSATAGTISIFFVYTIGSALYSKWSGVVSAAFLAVFPLHVTCSRYMKEDALLVCLTLAVLVAVLAAAKRESVLRLLLSGFLVGVATSAKYSGLLTYLLLLIAPWLVDGAKLLSPNRRLLKFLPLAFILAPIGFVLITPYSVLNFSGFIHDVRLEKIHMLRGHTVPIDAWSQFWMYHLSRSILPGIGAVSLTVSLLGVGVLFYRRRFSDLLVLGLILVFYLPSEWVRAKPAPQPERYILPCLPFIAIALSQIGSMLWCAKLRTTAIVIVVAALLFPLRRSVQLTSEIRNDTRERLSQWMLANVPPGSKIYVDWKPYTPSLSKEHFQVSYIPRANIMRELDLANLKRQNYDYLILSSLSYDRYFNQPHPDAASRERIRQVFRRVPIVKQVAPVYGTYGFHNPVLTLFSLRSEDFAKLENDLVEKRMGRIHKTSNEAKASLAWNRRIW